MGRRALVVDWNGKDVPSGLHDLPAGRYIVEAVNDADDVPLTEAQDSGVEHALAQYRQGQVVDAYEYLIGRADIEAAQHVDAAVSRVVERLACREFEGPFVTLRSGARVRSWPAPPFRVIYTRDGEVLVVLRVYHQARLPLDR